MMSHFNLVLEHRNIAEQKYEYTGRLQRDLSCGELHVLRGVPHKLRQATSLDGGLVGAKDANT